MVRGCWEGLGVSNTNGASRPSSKGLCRLQCRNPRPLPAGVEFAGMLARLGSDVHLAYRDDLPLKKFDNEVGRGARGGGW